MLFKVNFINCFTGHLLDHIEGRSLIINLAKNTLKIIAIYRVCMFLLLIFFDFQCIVEILFLSDSDARKSFD